MIFLKLMLSSGRGKEFVTNWIKNKLYLKFGTKLNTDIKDIRLEEKEGRIYLHLDVCADCSNDDFYDILEKIAK